jgi:hypothetical protein
MINRSIYQYIQINNKGIKMEQKEEKKGRGWHGDSAGHAKAGRQGGKARAAKKQLQKERSKNGNQRNQLNP